MISRLHDPQAILRRNEKWRVACDIGISNGLGGLIRSTPSEIAAETRYSVDYVRRAINAARKLQRAIAHAVESNSLG